MASDALILKPIDADLREARKCTERLLETGVIIGSAAPASRSVAGLMIGLVPRAVEVSDLAVLLPSATNSPN